MIHFLEQKASKLSTARFDKGPAQLFLLDHTAQSTSERGTFFTFINDKFT
jgi:hypothetical protein